MLIRSNRKRDTECKNINYLYPRLNNNIKPINENDPNCRKNLCKYYIKTAYNACSGGDYTNDYVDICILTAIIKQGVRCLDFQIFSMDDNPVVSTSTLDNLHVKETYNYVSFANVMNTINSNAFASGTCPNYTDPLIIHLRINSNNQKMFTKLAKILGMYSNRMLGSKFSYNNTSTDTNDLANTPILSLKNKIIIIVNKSNDAFLENDDLMEFVNMVSMSLKMRIYDYVNIKNMSLNDKSELLSFNYKNMTIVIPDRGNKPPNPDPTICRASGCQMVAMRYQLGDGLNKADELFFNQTGYAFVLKPRRSY
jgi:hypothetical protein